MPIRWKLLILLLAMSVLPLIFISAYGIRATREMGLGLTERGSKIAAERYSEQLLQMTDQSAAILGHQQALVELSLKVQAMQAESRLAGDPPAEARVFFDHDYDSGENLPPGMIDSPKHLRKQKSGKTVPSRITFGAQVIRLAPGVAPEAEALDIARLSGMAAAYRNLYQENPDLYFWLYTSLESGVHSSYPGHGGYPPSYDGRKRLWYLNAKKEGKLVWSSPLVDATTRQVLLTVSMPVRRPDGSFGGVTAIDVQILPILQEIRARSALSENVQTFLATILPGGGEKSIQIIAHRGYSGQTSDWQAAIKLDWLESDDKKGLARLAENMRRGRSGLIRMPRGGRDSLWAYRTVDDLSTYLVFVVPFDDVTARFTQLKEIVSVEAKKQSILVGIGSVAMILIVSVVAFFSSRSVTAPVGDLAAAARRISQGDFGARASVSGRDELAELGEVFNEMVPHLEDRLKVRQSLSMAREVQQSLLPEHSPGLEGFDIAGKSIYSDETGGDYYDFIDLGGAEGGRIGIAVGDVSGHSVASALLMTTVRALLRSQAAQPGDLAPKIGYINDYLAGDTSAGRFMTMFYMVIGGPGGEVKWVNAGHDAAIAYNPAEETFEELTATDIPLGIKSGWSYREFSRKNWISGRIVLIGTDGIWESRNAGGEMFGKEAVEIIVRRHASESASAICGAITKALEDFRGETRQLDDVTVVIVKASP